MPFPIRRALVSVSDKTGLADFGRFLTSQGVEILSTGGSARALSEAGVSVVEVSAHTGFPEIMDGRVKTLHPRIHGGLLGIRNNPEHEQAMQLHGIAPIDLLVVNLYPFEATVAAGQPFDACIENIDIGGPALIRAAAKNHAFVTVVVDAADYPRVMEAMQVGGGGVPDALRQALAAKAYAHTAAYDSAIAAWFASVLDEPLPERLVLAGSRRQMLRYGENPHQSAAFYVGGEARPGVASARQIQGKELSFNNLNDTDAAFELVAEFDEPAVAIIKHANPCGVAIGTSLADAYAKAFACDPVSAFGGIVAVNRPLDAATARAIAEIFLEVVIAPAVDDEAKAILAAKKNLRLLDAGGLPDPAAPGMTVRSLAGGYLLQGRDNAVTAAEVRTVTRRSPTNAEMADLMFAYRVAKHVKSNAIVFCKDGATVGVGAGQMSRVDSARLAAWKAEEARQAAGEAMPRTEGAVVASDAFFPFPDGLIACAEAGATAVIQPGGSVRDDEVIAAADDHGLAMVFTGLRHFRH
ncbi:MAG: bifunctional phosphoribosylaminoimidazolecarboxamide formyltransferase/IMP cyclohydrolase PurH [Rhodospirillales bacterium]|nr:MAG: bifunctional phosphoribosylaminoimidazolecarboxamide formyltransferase/IMP cyclohydrolase PurH [Rhodospirillales bacterium]